MTVAAARPSLSRAVTLLLALTSGLSVSAIYLVQPLLHTLGASLAVSTGAIGRVMTVTQIGYGLGILLLIPLGDVLPKKALVLKKLLCLAVALALTGFAPSFAWLAVGSLAIGLFGTTAQDVVPFAADLAAPERRGEVVGKVMSGLLLGILLSRTLSGWVSDMWGWRAVFWSASVLILGVAALLFMNVPEHVPQGTLSYAQLMRSTLRNVVTYPLLRRAIFTQGLLGVAFSAFWTNLSFHLAQPPFALSNTQIGLFGLAGAAGALAAPVAGKLADRRGSRAGIIAGTALVAGSFALMLAFGASLAVLILGTVVFDLGQQMSLISHQTAIYALNQEARARLNAVFVASMFASFSLGSLASVAIYTRWGFAGVLALALVTSTGALLSGLRRLPA